MNGYLIHKHVVLRVLVKSVVEQSVTWVVWNSMEFWSRLIVEPSPLFHSHRCRVIAR